MRPDDARLLRRDAVVLRLAIERRTRTGSTPPTTASVENQQRAVEGPSPRGGAESNMKVTVNMAAVAK